MSPPSPDLVLTGEAMINLQQTMVPDHGSSPPKPSAYKPASSSPRISVGKPESRVPGEAIRALRQSRLRAAASYLSLWWSFISIQSLLIGLPSVLPFMTVFGLAGAYTHLSLRPKIAPFGLKVIEAGIFGLMAGAFIVFQYFIMVTAAIHSDYHAIEISAKNGLINSLTLLLAYTLLIPNTLRSSAAMVVCLAFYPLATEAVILVWHPDVQSLIAQHRYLEPLGLNLTMTVVAGTLSLYGVHILDTLRQDAFEARRLNQYQIGDRLGAGGMGEVYQAEHRLLRRSCAVKMVRPEKSLDRRALAMLEREVRATAQLSHPNIVEVYDYGRTDDGSFYYVMEKLQGLNLAELVQQHGPLPVSRIIYLLRQACDGLGEAHAAGLVHRDLKLLDFGLVKESSLPEDAEFGERLDSNDNPTLTINGILMGTPLFMAPEQGFGDSSLQDHRADIYALGAIAYFLATGQPPFDGQSALKILKAHAYDNVLPPSHLLPVPQDFEQVVLRCLEKHPADRYSSADELGQALSECEDATSWDGTDARVWWAEHTSQSV
jgi:hypothetical protein